jgi:hypothetical protein
MEIAGCLEATWLSVISFCDLHVFNNFLVKIFGHTAAIAVILSDCTKSFY